ncbi:MAG: Rdx family protein [Anaerolineaceae bacterium]|nr:Rdx family protein [Anaerolineaceae bacterium]
MAAELLDAFEPGIQSITLIPSNGGAYEVTVNGVLIFSKLQSGRHAEAGEIKALLEKKIKEG